METPNSMSIENINSAVESLIKALILKNVKLEFRIDPKDYPYASDCPMYVRTIGNSTISGIPYILGSEGNHIYLKLNYLKHLGIPESEVIYHAKKNTSEKLEEVLESARDEAVRDGEKNKTISETLGIERSVTFGRKYYGSRDDALTDLVRLQHYVVDHGSMTVGDMKNYLDVTVTNPEDFKYGWRDLSKAYVKYVDCCYAIEFPEVERIYSGTYPFN